MSPASAMATNLGAKQIGENFVLLGSEAPTERRVGLYAKGSCDLNSIFACAPLIEEILGGTCCILKDGLVASQGPPLTVLTPAAVAATFGHQMAAFFQPRHE